MTLHLDKLAGVVTKSRPGLVLCTSLVKVHGLGSYCVSHMNGPMGKMHRTRNKGKVPSLRSVALHGKGKK